VGSFLERKKDNDTVDIIRDMEVKYVLGPIVLKIFTIISDFITLAI
tara:strand:+ start:7026 stop:7163 length:138 start_codon:yes stop_codon:yes gene_type:complete